MPSQSTHILSLERWSYDHTADSVILATLSARPSYKLIPMLQQYLAEVRSEEKKTVQTTKNGVVDQCTFFFADNAISVGAKVKVPVQELGGEGAYLRKKMR